MNTVVFNSPIKELIKNFKPYTQIIFKVRKLLNNQKEYFYYTEDRSLMVQIKPTKEEVRLMKDNYEIFIKYTVLSNKQILLTKINNQDW